jgi:transposase InsO family protein
VTAIAVARSAGAGETVLGMSRARVAVLKVVSRQMSATEAAVAYGYSRRHLQRLLARYRLEGLDGVEPRSRRPRSNSAQIPEEVRERVLALRRELVAQGSDAGPLTIAWHLEREGVRVPARSTISRILSGAGLVVPEPRKRPRSSYARFEASQPNECWQSDVTHWRLADGADAEILSWLDDHSRYLLACTAHQPVSGETVVVEFCTVIDRHGPPASTLTDNGSIYTSRFTGGRNRFEYLLRILEIRQKNGSPGHPQTQGKIERFHQTLKRWLAARPAPQDLAELQQHLDRFSAHYNEQRPHRALDRTTPGQAYRQTPKALPAGSAAQAHFRVRYDRLDTKGHMSLRRAGRMHHLAVGYAHAGTRVLALGDQTQITVINLATGEILSRHHIDPDRGYWRNQDKEPGRWPSSPRRDI